MSRDPSGLFVANIPKYLSYIFCVVFFYHKQMTVLPTIEQWIMFAH